MAAATTRLDTSRISFGEMVAGVSAVVLLISMFLPWYGASLKGGIGQFQVSRSSNATAWEAYGGRDILLLLIVIVVLGYVLLRALDALPADLPFDPPLVVLVLGGLAALMVFIGILHIPTGGEGEVSTSLIKVDFSRKFGLFLGFLASLGIAYGGWAAYNERRRGVAPGAAGPGGAPGGPSGPTPTAPSPGAGPTEPSGTSQPPASSPSPGPGAPPSTPPSSDPGAGPGASPGASASAATPPASTPPAATPPGAAPPAQPSQSQPNPPADWYPDPHEQARLRWWDGSQWTDQTAN